MSGMYVRICRTEEIRTWARAKTRGLSWSFKGGRERRTTRLYTRLYKAQQDVQRAHPNGEGTRGMRLSAVGAGHPPPSRPAPPGSLASGRATIQRRHFG